MMSVQLTELDRLVRAVKKVVCRETSNFRKQIFRVLFRDLQITGSKAPANGCSPVPGLSDSEAKTPPIPRIASCWFERQQKYRNLQTHAQNQRTRLSRVAPVECVPSPTCAIERTGELEESVSAHPLVSAGEGPRQLLSPLCLAELHWFCGLVILFPQDFASCPSRLSALQAVITPTCTFFSVSLSRRLTLLCFVVPSRETFWPRSMRQSSGCSPFSPPCFVLRNVPGYA